MSTVIVPLLVWLVSGPSLAAQPSLFPVLAPRDAPEQYAAWLQATGRPAQILACEPYVGEVLLCFKTEQNKKRRWVTQADLRRWKLDTKELRQQAVAAIDLHESAILQPATVPEMPSATYWIATGSDGWATAMLLDPARIGQRLNSTDFLVAAPSETVLLAWKDGDPELNRIMAVGVWDIHESQSGPVSAVVFRWHEGQLSPWGEAHPSAAPRSGLLK